MYTVKVAETQDEMDEAYELVYRCFGENYFNAKEKFEARRRFDPTARVDNTFIAINESGNVIATTPSLDRKIRIFGKEFFVGAPTANAVHPEYRSGQLFFRMNRFMLDEYQRKGCDISLTYASRRVDQSLKYLGFWGAPVERSIKYLDLPVIKKCNLIFSQITETHLDFINKLYREVYGKLSVNLERGPELWRYILNRPDFKKTFSAYICSDSSGEYVGYVFAEKNKRIIEVCAVNEEDYLNILFAPDSPVSKIAHENISVSFEHPVVKILNGYSTSVFTRHPNYGGHILRIIDPYNMDSEINQLLIRKLEEKEVEINNEYTQIPENVLSRVFTAALFGYEVPETRKILSIPPGSLWERLKPTDFLFSSLDEY